MCNSRGVTGRLRRCSYKINKLLVNIEKTIELLNLKCILLTINVRVSRWDLEPLVWREGFASRFVLCRSDLALNSGVFQYATHWFQTSDSNHFGRFPVARAFPTTSSYRRAACFSHNFRITSGCMSARVSSHRKCA